MLRERSHVLGAVMQCMPLTQFTLRTGAKQPLRSLRTCTAWEAAAQPPTDAASKHKTPAIRRFWRSVSVAEQPSGYQVLLDKRPIKTPDGHLISIATQQPALAWLVAGEWESQKEFLGPHSLPLTSLISRAIDGLNNPSTRSDVISKLLKYFQTDSVCLHDEYPQALVDLQQRHYTPIVDWARSKYSIDIATTSNMFALRQSAEATEKLRQAVAGFSPLKLAALERAVMTAKSFLIGLALVELHIPVEDAALAAQAEANAQTQLWGELENAHDLDNAAMRQILGASACAAAGA
ncbi:chaperone [Coemansia sp. RSA 2336]|nr:chaperone [Coemansia sp. RSA 2336]